MTKTGTVLLMLLVTIVLIIPSGCYEDVEIQNYDFSGFNKIKISSAFKVEIAQASSHNISVAFDAGKIEDIEVTKAGNQLIIGIKPQSSPVHFHTLEAKITLPDIIGLIQSGATICNLHGFNFSHEISLNLSGASKLDGDLDTGDVHLIVSGASNLHIKGAANDILADISGASNVNLSDFEVNNANISLSSASKATITLDGFLDASLSGASKLTYKGSPILGNLNTTGGSSIDKG